MCTRAPNSVFPTRLLGALATFVFVLGNGCGAGSSPQQVCNSITQMSFPGDPQIAGFLASAGTKDCLLGVETDTEKAASLKSQGQLDALKGFLLMGVQTARGGVSTDSLKAKIVSASDVNTALGFVVILKVAGRFSDADIAKLDSTYPHLGLAEAFRNYSQPIKPS
jgi:hypothetical protein